MGRIKKSKNQEISTAGVSALQEILTSIKSDDLTLFSRHIEQKRSNLLLCYGQFPILSICYLYGSKKIVKAYEKALISVSNYNYIEEDYEVYKKFKVYAKRCLRLYYLRKSVVSPLEMLSILNDSYYLKQVYSDFPKSEKIKTNIAKIYIALHNQTIDTTEENLKIKRKPLSKLQKICLFTAVIFASIIIGVSITAWKGVYTIYGKGSAEEPFIIYNEKQFISALKEGNDYYNLSKDITLTSEWTASDFSGNLNGNGHTIYMKDNVKKGFISELTGKIENVTFVFSKLEMEITEDTSLVIKTNNGLINNVSLKLSGEFVENSDSEELHFALLTLENIGEINNCVIDADILFTGNGEKDAFFSGFAAYNKGNVLNSYTTDTSRFETETVDISGIVTINESIGVVSGCINYAEILHHSSNENWSPNASGIVLINHGLVTKCTNKGNITASSTTLENRPFVYVGGIVCRNQKEINKSKNYGDLKGFSDLGNISIGGITSLNYSELSLVDSSGSEGHISVALKEVTDRIYLFAAGIAGFNDGTVKNSYFAASFEAENGVHFLGGISAVANYNTAVYENNYYITQANVKFGSASVLFGNTLYEGTDVGVTAITGLEELKELEVYWE